MAENRNAIFPSSLDIENDWDLAFPEFTLEPPFIPATVQFESHEHEPNYEKRIVALMEQNNYLKENLQQNNLAMKQQYNKLSLWQKNVLKVHQRQLDRFEETKDFISKLLVETNTLKTELHLLRNKNAELRNANDQLNQYNKGFGGSSVEVKTLEQLLQDKKNPRRLQSVSRAIPLSRVGHSSS